MLLCCGLSYDVFNMKDIGFVFNLGSLITFNPLAVFSTEENGVYLFQPLSPLDCCKILGELTHVSQPSVTVLVTSVTLVSVLETRGKGKFEGFILTLFQGIQYVVVGKTAEWIGWWQDHEARSMAILW